MNHFNTLAAALVAASLLPSVGSADNAWPMAPSFGPTGLAPAHAMPFPGALPAAGIAPFGSGYAPLPVYRGAYGYPHAYPYASPFGYGGYNPVPFMDPGMGGMMPGMASAAPGMASMFPGMASAVPGMGGMLPGFGDSWWGGYPYAGYYPYGAPLGVYPAAAPALADDASEMPVADADAIDAVAAAPALPAAPAPIDTDQDGVMDAADLCPDSTQGEAIDALGCTATGPIVLEGVNFHTDSALLTDESSAILDRVATTLVANPEVKVEVAGHTDSDADDGYNLRLSQARTNTVVAYLVAKGVSADKLVAKGYGEAQPLVANDSAEHKAMNRRVELRRI